MIPKDISLNLLYEFDKTPTASTLAFEIFVILGTIIVLLILSRIKNKIPQRYLLVAAGILIFEIFTAPMWNNLKLGWWGYVYRDVSWVLTIGWATMILTAVIIVDKLFEKWREGQRFILYLLLLTAAVFIAESAVLSLGIRTYSPEVLDTLTGYYIGNVPIEGLYYVPVFISLVIAFYKYGSFSLDNEAIVPVKNRAWVRNLILAFIGVFFFELMIEPMVVNAKFPSWSYIYQDISIIMSGLWIVIIWLSVSLVDKVFIHLDLVKRFVLYLVVGTIIFLPLESWFIVNRFRIYGPSAVENFVGINLPIINIPVEVALAIPFYLALIISFIRYWEINLDNKR